MKRAAALVLALGFLAGAAAQSAPGDSRIERVAALGKLWAAVKYFHPYLAYKQLDWDAPLLAALSKAAAAGNTAEYAGTVQSMLDALGDPVTTVVPNQAVATPSSQPLLQEVGGVLVITLNPATVADARLPRLGEEIDQANAVVFDLRNQGSWGAGQSSAVGLLFVSAGLNTRLISGVLKMPGQRGRVHSGLAAPWDGGSVYYHSAFFVRDGTVIQGAGGEADKPVVFLVDPSSNLPPIAVALQAAGKAKIVAAGGLSDSGLVEKHLITLPQGVQVQLRATELVYEDGTGGPVPDLSVPASAGSPLEAALKLVRTPRPWAAAPRPSLPAYGVPLREESYSRPEYPDWAHRMLAAFRIWSAFEYFHAYRSLMDDDWDKVLMESLARLDTAADTRAYALALAAMLSHTDDSHVSPTSSRAFDEFLGTARPEVTTRIIEGLPVITAAPSGSGLAPGDVVLRVEGEESAARLARLKPYFAASTPQSLDRKLMQVWLNGAPESAAVLSVRDGAGSVKEVRVPRTAKLRPLRERTGETARVLDGNIGYVDLDGLAPSGVNAMFEKLKGTRAIIFDMRGYPQGTAWLIAPRLTDRRQVAAARFRRPLAFSPPGISGDVATLGAAWDFQQYLPESDQWKYRGRTVMLIDERTMSQAEHAGLFFEAANGTRFIGSRTAGANGDVTRVIVPGGISISFSGQEIRHADGRALQRVGLIPDIEVKPTIAGIRAGRDEVLERALEYLKQ